MGTIVAGMATSHAFAFMEPAKWDEFRARNRRSLQHRTGLDPKPHPRIEAETLADNETRYARLRVAHQALAVQLRDSKPDALVVIGDDQNENFVTTMPQIAVFVGKSLRLGGNMARSAASYSTHQPLAQAIVERGVAEGFDVTSIAAFENDELKSHAHVQVLEALAGSGDVPVVVVFLNAIHHPAIAPRRCYAFGQAMRRAIADRPASERVAICASGGLSHFTAGYPWKNYNGPFAYGEISEEFDRRAIALIERGEGDKLAEMTSEELLAHGDIEMRAWIALLGALGPVPAGFAVYEPFYRAIMGMAVASWPAPSSQRASHE